LDSLKDGVYGAIGCGFGAILTRILLLYSVYPLMIPALLDFIFKKETKQTKDEEEEEKDNAL